MSESLLSQSVPPVAAVRDEHLGRRAKAKAHYDKTANRDFSPLSPGQPVYTRPSDHHRGEQWRYGEVLEEVTPRSYVVRTSNGLVRRNRTHLRPAERSTPCKQQTLEPQSTDSGDGSVPGEPSDPTETEPIVEMEAPVESPVQTPRYDRPIRPPKRLDL